MNVKSYYSDPKWNDSLMGRFFWIYKGKGQLSTNETQIIFKNNNFYTVIEKEKMISMKLRAYHWTAKPVTLNYIDICYLDDFGNETSIYFTPIDGNAWLTPVWSTNTFVKKCLSELQEWVKIK